MSTTHTQIAEHIHIFASGSVLFLLSTYHFPLTIHFCRVLGKSDPFCCFEQRLPFTCKIPARCGLFQSHLTTPSSSFAVIAQLQNLYTSLFLSISCISFPSSSPHHKFSRSDREFTDFISVVLHSCTSSQIAHFQHLRHISSSATRRPFRCCRSCHHHITVI